MLIRLRNDFKSKFVDSMLICLVTYNNQEYSVIDELDKNYKKYFPLIFDFGRYTSKSEKLDYLTESFKNYYFGDKSIRENIQGFSKASVSQINRPVTLCFEGRYIIKSFS